MARIIRARVRPSVLPVEPALAQEVGGLARGIGGKHQPRMTGGHDAMRGQSRQAAAFLREGRFHPA